MYNNACNVCVLIWVCDTMPAYLLVVEFDSVPVSRSRSSPVPEVVAYFRHGYATVQE